MSTISRGRYLPQRKIAGRTIRASKSRIRRMTIKASEHQIPSFMELSGTVEIEASAQLENGQVLSGGERFLLLANSGKPMELEGFFDPVVIDLAGAKFDKAKTAIIADHNTSLRIGHTIEQKIVAAGTTAKVGSKTLTGPMIAAVGVRSSKMAIAQGFIDDSKEGFPFQVSVGAKIQDGYFVAEGEVANVNGRNWKGPLIVASKTLIRELTITVLGADNDTATIAARTKLSKESAMDPFEKWLEEMKLDIEAMSEDSKVALKAQYDKLQSIPAPPKRKIKAKAPAADPEDEEDDDEEDLVSRKKKKFVRASADSHYQSALADEEVRIDEIRATALRFDHVKEVEVDGKKMTMSKLKAHAIREKWTADQLELYARRAEYPEPGAVPAIHSKDSKLEAKILEAALLKTTGLCAMGVNKNTGTKYGYEAYFDEKTLEASDEKKYQQINSISKLFDLQIRAAGKHPTSIDKEELFAQAHDAWHGIRASGFSTLSVTNVLENVMHKTAMASFNAMEGIWRFVCGRRPLNDFKPHALYQLDYNGSYRKVAADGELKHISLVDSKKTISAETYGAMITIDRKTRRDDDLGIITSKASGLGVLGAQRVEESVWVLILSNPSSFFASGNNNLISGGSSALSTTSLETARQKFRDQVVNGKPIGVSPTILITGTTLINTAENLWTLGNGNGVQLGYGNTDTGLVFVNNPHKGLYRPYNTPYLNNTAVLDQDGRAISGQSSTQWYLSAPPDSPQGSGVVIGFLDGRETPYFDKSETQFSIPGGLQFRSYFDWGLAMHLYQLLLKSAGA